MSEEVEFLNYIYKKLGIVFENVNTSFIQDVVMDEIAFPLETLQYKSDKIEKSVNEISEKLNIKHLLTRNINTLTDSEKQKVLLAVALVTNPQILIIDDGLTALNEKDRKEILTFLHELTKTDNLTVFYMTSNSEDSLYGDDIAVLCKNKIVKSGSKEEIYKDEELFIDAGLDLPFIINLSKKLQFYDLINKDYLDAEKMVNDLWE